MNNLNKAYCGKNVMITGGMGQMGSTVAKLLVELGANVKIIDAMLPMYGGNEFNIHGLEDKIEVCYADIRDSPAMNRLVKNQDFIFNFAGQVSHNDSISNPDLDLAINCQGHLNVLNAVKNYNPNAKIMYSGSRIQFGKIVYLPVDEHHPRIPLSVYGVHKNTGEQYYQAYFKHHNIKTVCFRIANPYGPRAQMKHHKYTMPNWFIRQAMENKTIPIFGDGSQLRDYMYIDDLANAFVMAGASEKADGEVFNIGSGVGTRFVDMVTLIIKTVGSGKTTSVPWPKNYENVETGDYVANITKITKTLDWKPLVSLEAGIKKTVDYYKKNKQHYFNNVHATF
jgi:nucleoside-diphosphate-sugar epimerase